jgi:hypothetical protein
VRLTEYHNLIRSLPYLDQAFETSKRTWSSKKYMGNSKFSSFYKNTFNGCSTVKLARYDLLKTANEDFSSAIFSIIFWGYPRNMRGNHFFNIVKEFDKIEELLTIDKNLGEHEFKALAKQLKNKGIGLSTLSKILYFFRFTVEGYKCLILDSRIIDVLNSQLYEELHELNDVTEYNKIGNYYKYLEVMRTHCYENNLLEDQLELFLFMFGKNLKSSNKIKNILL